MKAINNVLSNNKQETIKILIETLEQDNFTTTIVMEAIPT